MIYEHQFGPVINVDQMDFDDPASAADHKNPEAELRALRATTGGFKLCQKLLSYDGLYMRARSFFVCTQASWTWYDSNVKNILSPMDGLKETIRMTTRGRKVLFEEVINLLRHSLQNKAALDWIGFERDVPSYAIRTQQLYVGQHVSFLLILAGQRTLAKLKYLTPPWCYSGLSSEILVNEKTH